MNLFLFRTVSPCNNRYTNVVAHGEQWTSFVDVMISISSFVVYSDIIFIWQLLFYQYKQKRKSRPQKIYTRQLLRTIATTGLGSNTGKEIFGSNQQRKNSEF